MGETKNHGRSEHSLIGGKVEQLQQYKVEFVEGEIRVTFLSFGNKADSLVAVFSLLERGRIDKKRFNELRESILASDLDDGDLIPRVEICGCGRHITIHSFAERIECVGSRELFDELVNRWISQGIITPSEATDLEAEALSMVTSLSAVHGQWREEFCGRDFSYYFRIFFP